MNKRRNIYLPLILILVVLFIPVFIYGQGEVIFREAANTLTPIEMNIGDTLKFKLRNGQVRTIVLEETSADVLFTNLKELKKDPSRRLGITLYHFTGKIKIDGKEMTLERYVSSQESFYEPYVINGLRIWFDGVSDISEIMLKEHGGEDCECIPVKAARFAMTDMTDNISPIELNSLYRNKKGYIDITEVYDGSDTWMGGYLGVEAHGGLDINMPTGSRNFTPFPIDDHYFFYSLGNGDRYNRWRGAYQWENGHIWTIENHHMLNLRVPEHLPIESGTYYADAAGVALGAHEHEHYLFKIKSPENEKEILLDPWILFWQAFEDEKNRDRDLNASMAPLNPGMAGHSVYFSSNGPTADPDAKEFNYYWTFGDGGWSNEKNPYYTYVNPGIYPVTLVVDHGGQKDSFTQHITIDGEKVNKPALALMAKDEPSFRKRPVHAMDVYAAPVQFIPHSLHFIARPTRSKPDEKFISLINIGSGILNKAIEPKVFYLEGEGWLSIKHKGKGNDQNLVVRVNASGLATGVYSATVQVEAPDALNSPQNFLVQLTIPSHPPAHSKTRDLDQEIIDNSDKRYYRFYSTPSFWIAPRFFTMEEKGYNDFYLSNGGRAKEGEFARFTPDLEAGTYEVSFAQETPFEPERRALIFNGQKLINEDFNPDSRFAVRVRFKGGEETVWVEPAKSRVIGSFEFEEGMDGFVDILAEGSKGHVLVDAIVFKKIKY